MSVPTVTTTQTAPITSVTAATTVSATSAGLSSTASTLTSSDQNGVSFCSKIKAGFIRFCDTMCHTLLQLPFIGSFFRNNAHIVAAADRHIVEDIRAKFGSTAIPCADDVDYMVHVFLTLITPVAEMEVFHHVLTAPNSTDEIARQFYANLSIDMQQDFKRQIWVANNEQDNGHGFGYGDYVVAHEIRGQVARDASALHLYTLNARIAAGLPN